jgi:predicted ester cyclase
MASVSASATETVRTFLSAFERNDTATLANLLSDDMTLSGPVPQPTPKERFIALDRALITSMPNWQFHARDWRQEGDKVVCTVEITGTHTGMLAALPGVPPVHATGKQIHLPEEHLTFTLRGDKISNITVDQVPGGGVPGIYAQVGHSIS